MLAWLFFWRKSVDKILASFTKTINQLDGLYERCSFRADLLAQRAKANATEAERARNVAEKLRKLIS